MIIKHYTGKTKEEAEAAARRELGSDAVILNVKEISEGGFLGLFKKTSYDVTASLDDDGPRQTFAPRQASSSSGNRFNQAADEEISLSEISAVTPEQEIKTPVPAHPENMTAATIRPETKMPESTGSQTQLKDAFAAVNEVMQARDPNYNKNIYSAPKPTAKSRPQPALQQEASAAQPSFADVDGATEPFYRAYSGDNQKFVKSLYNILLENEVQEKYINRLLDDMENVLRRGSNLDFLLTNVYQKLVLKLGQPHEITLKENQPKVVFFIGPTGVGKTTTIAKIAAKHKVEQHKNVVLLTTDTYRIAATDQLRTYADILKVPLCVCFSPEEMNETLAKYSDQDLILVDTAGFSHKNAAQREDMEQMLNQLNPDFEREVYLVLSATTKYKDLTEIIDTYSAFTDFYLIFTKLDETNSLGNIFNCRLYCDAQLSYLTNGQNVPADIEVVDTQKVVRQLMGGH